MSEKEEKNEEEFPEGLSGGKQGVDEGKDPKKDLEKTEKERDEYLDGWKRAKADLINYKKDELRRLEEVARFGSESLILELISILDDFDLALATLEKEGTAEKGIYLIKSRFEDILKRRGLERIKVEEGDKFDPNYHEAIIAVQEEGKEADTVAEEIEAGYTLHGKVIRPARVRVYGESRK